jgi:hexokinase
LKRRWRKGLRFIRITALVNDTIGTLVSKSYADRSCDAGVILGTGTNACYPEKISNIARNKNPGRDGEMIINIEWGNFAGLAQTPYDVELDKCSRNPGFQFLEKMVSGMYLGALASKMLADMGLRGVSEFFRGGHELKTEDMSRIAGNDFRALAESGLEHIGPDERKTLQNICGLTARRSARLAGAAIAAVIPWMDPQLLREHLVGIDGSLFELYPRYRENICGVFDDIFGAKARGIRLELAKDGSGIGAAITAAIAEQTGQ